MLTDIIDFDLVIAEEPGIAKDSLSTCFICFGANLDTQMRVA